MKSTQELMAEHDAMLVSLKLLEKVEGVLTKKESPALEHLEQLLDFLRGFVDRCHYAKEEEILFPELERRGVKREGGPIGTLLEEHETGRRHVREIAAGLVRLRKGEAEAGKTIRNDLQAYRDLQRAHIEKENTVLFPLADRRVPDDVAAEMMTRFEGMERDRVGEGKHEMYHAMLDCLQDEYGMAEAGCGHESHGGDKEPGATAGKAHTMAVKPQAHPVLEMVSYQTGTVVSREIVKKNTGSVTVFAFDQGQGLSEHTAPFDALVYVLDGVAEITIGGAPHRLGRNDLIVMPAHVPHALKAVERFKMMLVMIREAAG